MRLLGFLPLLLLGCSPDPVCRAEYVPDPHPDVVLSVQSPRLFEASECAAARWHSATGVRISARVERSGNRSDLLPVAAHTVTVRYAPTDDSSGDFDPATMTADVNPYLDPDWVWQVVAHEIGHALESPEVSHLPWGVRGLMRGDALSHDDDFIGTADLELICGGEKPLVPCVWMRAER